MGGLGGEAGDRVRSRGAIALTSSRVGKTRGSGGEKKACEEFSLQL